MVSAEPPRPACIDAHWGPLDYLGPFKAGGEVWQSKLHQFWVKDGRCLNVIIRPDRQDVDPRRVAPEWRDQ